VVEIIKDQTFNIDFYIESEQFKEIKYIHDHKEQFPLVLGPTVLFRAKIVLIKSNEVSGVATVSFKPEGVW
jgi:hypothetical protein